MNTAQLAQLTAMTQSERLGYYFKKLVNKDISKEQYDKAIKFVATLPNPSPIETPGEVRADDRQPWNGNSRGYVTGEVCTSEGQSEQGRGQTNEPVSRESFITALERNDKSVLPRHTDGSRLGETNTHTDIISGDSQNARVWRLLQDGAWHDANEIQLRVYGANHLGSAAIPTRVSNINAKLREKGKGKIESRAKEGSLWEWRYVEKDPVTSTFYGGK